MEFSLCTVSERFSSAVFAHSMVEVTEHHSGIIAMIYAFISTIQSHSRFLTPIIISLMVIQIHLSTSAAPHFPQKVIVMTKTILLTRSLHLISENLS